MPQNILHHKNTNVIGPKLRDRYTNLSPGALNVKTAHEGSVLRIVVYLSWFHECADVCFGSHLI